MGKILYVDLDGTLLDDEKKISEGNRTAIRRMLEEGHYFVICTGRPAASGRIVAQELGLVTPGCYMVCFNGAVIYDCSADRILMRHSVPIQDVLHLFDAARRAGIHVQTYNDTDIVTLAHTKELDYYRTRSNMSYKVVDNILNALPAEPQKVLMVDLHRDGRLKRFQEKNLSWTKDRLMTVFSCDEFLEYCPKGIDKGYGIEYLSHFLNIPVENTVAVGDERNDISMIRAAHIGIAVQNACAEAKEAADFITEKDNNHDAIAEVIERFIL